MYSILPSNIDDVDDIDSNDDVYGGDDGDNTNRFPSMVRGYQRMPTVDSIVGGKRCCHRLI